MVFRAGAREQARACTCDGASKAPAAAALEFIYVYVRREMSRDGREEPLSCAAPQLRRAGTGQGEESDDG
eukprot:6199954-Pleurochrysis_carterae.AAC.5